MRRFYPDKDSVTRLRALYPDDEAIGACYADAICRFAGRSFPNSPLTPRDLGLLSPTRRDRQERASASEEFNQTSLWVAAAIAGENAFSCL